MTTVLDRLLANRIAILDGAMGTMVQRHQLGEAGTCQLVAEWLDHHGVVGHRDLWRRFAAR